MPRDDPCARFCGAGGLRGRRKGAAGSVFPDDPDTVTAWTFDGYPATEVLGIRYGKNSFGVFVADTVPAEERDRIYADLTKRRLTLHTPEG